MDVEPTTQYTLVNSFGQVVDAMKHTDLPKARKVARKIARETFNTVSVVRSFGRSDEKIIAQYGGGSDF